MSGIQVCCFSGRNKRKIINYETLSMIKTGSNAGLYAKCYFHMQVMYHNLFSFLCFVYKMIPIMLIIIKEQEKVKRRRCIV